MLQKEIVRILDNLIENEQRAKELCDDIEEIDLMKKAILGRVFRGELVLMIQGRKVLLTY